MVVSNTNAEEIAVLQELIHNSRSIQATSRTTSQFDALSNHASSSSLTFPPLPDLVSHLQTVGLSDRATSKIVYAFQTGCFQLQTLHLAALSKMLANSAAEHGKALEAYVFESYMQKLVALRKDILVYAKREHEKLPSKPNSTPNKPWFNHDYVPALEKYFEYNAYPSAADRALMARKSMMTNRQIEVWFQNHRNRARKDGKPLARLHSSEPLPSDVSFDSLDATMGDLIRPESERREIEQQRESEDDESGGIEALVFSLGLDSSSPTDSVDGEHGSPKLTQQLPQPQTNPLNAPAPPFAYPAPYVPQAQSFLDAPTQHPSLTFPKPQWARQPANTRINLPLARRDIDHLTDLFVRLTVRESVKKQGRRRTAAMPQSSSPTASQRRWMSTAATCAITTILCPGRHPAFIPSVAPVSLRGTRKSPSPSLQYHFQSCMSSPGAGPSKPSTLPQRQAQAAACVSPKALALTTAPRRRRKSPQLPHRVPACPPVSHPSPQSQAQSGNLPQPSLHPHASPSRATSSAPSSSSASSRVSSSSSSASSPPRTPNSSTVSLPTSYTDDASKSSTNGSSTPSVFGSRDIADIFGDAASAFTTSGDPNVGVLGPSGFGLLDMALASNVFDFNLNIPQTQSSLQAR
ncbi:hypothetical protein BDN71DRAFT_37447 [Pleurotus eryngii]|uniref:Homeobox domain-containing protein n=1 Tax=Pleurotus eryngii TaxID=5323 RepID=A0A9P6ABM9_PLEER|nr:hypothetical protein BDN71DRAFT_37447 [Pleurotus eryngii]